MLWCTVLHLEENFTRRTMSEANDGGKLEIQNLNEIQTPTRFPSSHNLQHVFLHLKHHNCPLTVFLLAIECSDKDKNILQE